MWCGFQIVIQPNHRATPLLRRISVASEFMEHTELEGFHIAVTETNSSNGNRCKPALAFSVLKNKLASFGNCSRFFMVSVMAHFVPLPTEVGDTLPMPGAQDRGQGS
jgi:hypothetical protein